MRRKSRDSYPPDGMMRTTVPSTPTTVTSDPVVGGHGLKSSSRNVQIRLECLAWIFLGIMAGLLLAATPSNAAPVADANHNWNSMPGTCFYMLNHYQNGERIMTNEPCLNCTCQSGMVMCFLKMCPFAKPVGKNCIVEKEPGECCPRITCPEVPVPVMMMLMGPPSTSTTTPPPHVSSLEAYDGIHGCEIDNKYYSDGARVPSDPNNPCDLCYCIRNQTACVKQECELMVDGCQPIYHDGVCCPVRYNCERRHLLTEPPTTTLLPGVSETLSSGCLHEAKFYADGSSIPSSDPCDHCYCMMGQITCGKMDCPTPLDNVANCTALPHNPDECCPPRYDCGEEDLSTTSDEEKTTTSSDLVEQTAGITSSFADPGAAFVTSSLLATILPEKSADNDTEAEKKFDDDTTAPEVESTTASEVTEPVTLDLLPRVKEKTSQKPVDEVFTSPAVTQATPEEPEALTTANLSQLIRDQDVGERTTVASVSVTDESLVNKTVSATEPAGPKAAFADDDEAEDLPTDFQIDEPKTSDVPTTLTTRAPDAAAETSTTAKSTDAEKTTSGQEVTMAENPSEAPQDAETDLATKKPAEPETTVVPENVQVQTDGTTPAQVDDITVTSEATDKTEDHSLSADTTPSAPELVKTTQKVAFDEFDTTRIAQTTEGSSETEEAIQFAFTTAAPKITKRPDEEQATEKVVHDDDEGSVTDFSLVPETTLRSGSPAETDVDILSISTTAASDTSKEPQKTTAKAISDEESTTETSLDKKTTTESEVPTEPSEPTAQTQSEAETTVPSEGLTVTEEAFQFAVITTTEKSTRKPDEQNTTSQVVSDEAETSTRQLSEKDTQTLQSSTETVEDTKIAATTPALEAATGAETTLSTRQTTAAVSDADQTSTAQSPISLQDEVDEVEYTTQPKVEGVTATETSDTTAGFDAAGRTTKLSLEKTEIPVDIEFTTAEADGSTSPSPIPTTTKKPLPPSPIFEDDADDGDFVLDSSSTIPAGPESEETSQPTTEDDRSEMKEGEGTTEPTRVTLPDELIEERLLVKNETKSATTQSSTDEAGTTTAAPATTFADEKPSKLTVMDLVTEATTTTLESKATTAQKPLQEDTTATTVRAPEEKEEQTTVPASQDRVQEQAETETTVGPTEKPKTSAFPTLEPDQASEVTQPKTTAERAIPTTTEGQSIEETTLKVTEAVVSTDQPITASSLVPVPPKPSEVRLDDAAEDPELPPDALLAQTTTEGRDVFSTLASTEAQQPEDKSTQRPITESTRTTASGEHDETTLASTQAAADGRTTQVTEKSPVSGVTFEEDTATQAVTDAMQTSDLEETPPTIFDEIASQKTTSTSAPATDKIEETTKPHIVADEVDEDVTAPTYAQTDGETLPAQSTTIPTETITEVTRDGVKLIEADDLVELLKTTPEPGSEEELGLRDDIDGDGLETETTVRQQEGSSSTVRTSVAPMSATETEFTVDVTQASVKTEEPQRTTLVELSLEEGLRTTSRIQDVTDVEVATTMGITVADIQEESTTIPGGKVTSTEKPGTATRTSATATAKTSDVQADDQEEEAKVTKLPATTSQTTLEPAGKTDTSESRPEGGADDKLLTTVSQEVPTTVQPAERTTSRADVEDTRRTQPVESETTPRPSDTPSKDETISSTEASGTTFGVPDGFFEDLIMSLKTAIPFADDEQAADLPATTTQQPTDLDLEVRILPGRNKTNTTTTVKPVDDLDKVLTTQAQATEKATTQDLMTVTEMSATEAAPTDSASLTSPRLDASKPQPEIPSSDDTDEADKPEITSTEATEDPKTADLATTVDDQTKKIELTTSKPSTDQLDAGSTASQQTQSATDVTRIQEDITTDEQTGTTPSSSSPSGKMPEISSEPPAAADDEVDDGIITVVTDEKPADFISTQAPVEVTTTSASTGKQEEQPATQTSIVEGSERPTTVQTSEDSSDLITSGKLASTAASTESPTTEEAQQKTESQVSTSSDGPVDVESTTMAKKSEKTTPTTTVKTPAVQPDLDVPDYGTDIFQEDIYGDEIGDLVTSAEEETTPETSQTEPSAVTKVRKTTFQTTEPSKEVTATEKAQTEPVTVTEGATTSAVSVTDVVDAKEPKQDGTDVPVTIPVEPSTAAVSRTESTTAQTTFTDSATTEAQSESQKPVVLITDATLPPGKTETETSLLETTTSIASDVAALTTTKKALLDPKEPAQQDDAEDELATEISEAPPTIESERETAAISTVTEEEVTATEKATTITIAKEVGDESSSRIPMHDDIEKDTPTTALDVKSDPTSKAELERDATSTTYIPETQTGVTSDQPAAEIIVTSTEAAFGDQKETVTTSRTSSEVPEADETSVTDGPASTTSDLSETDTEKPEAVDLKTSLPSENETEVTTSASDDTTDGAEPLSTTAATETREEEMIGKDVPTTGIPMIISTDIPNMLTGFISTVTSWVNGILQDDLDPTDGDLVPEVTTTEGPADSSTTLDAADLKTAHATGVGSDTTIQPSIEATTAAEKDDSKTERDDIEGETTPSQVLDEGTTVPPLQFTSAVPAESHSTELETGQAVTTLKAGITTPPTVADEVDEQPERTTARKASTEEGCIWNGLTYPHKKLLPLNPQHADYYTTICVCNNGTVNCSPCVFAPYSKKCTPVFEEGSPCPVHYTCVSDLPPTLTVMSQVQEATSSGADDETGIQQTTSESSPILKAETVTSTSEGPTDAPKATRTDEITHQETSTAASSEEPTTVPAEKAETTISPKTAETIAITIQEQEESSSTSTTEKQLSPELPAADDQDSVDLPSTSGEVEVTTHGGEPTTVETTEKKAEPSTTSETERTTPYAVTLKPVEEQKDDVRETYSTSTPSSSTHPKDDDTALTEATTKYAADVTQQVDVRIGQNDVNEDELLTTARSSIALTSAATSTAKVAAESTTSPSTVEAIELTERTTEEAVAKETSTAGLTEQTTSSSAEIIDKESDMPITTVVPAGQTEGKVEDKEETVEFKTETPMSLVTESLVSVEPETAVPVTLQPTSETVRKTTGPTAETTVSSSSSPPVAFDEADEDPVGDIHTTVADTADEVATTFSAGDAERTTDTPTTSSGEESDSTTKSTLEETQTTPASFAETAVTTQAETDEKPVSTTLAATTVTEEDEEEAAKQTTVAVDTERTSTSAEVDKPEKPSDDEIGIDDFDFEKSTTDDVQTTLAVGTTTEKSEVQTSSAGVTDALTAGPQDVPVPDEEELTSSEATTAASGAETTQPSEGEITTAGQTIATDQPSVLSTSSSSADGVDEGLTEDVVTTSSEVTVKDETATTIAGLVEEVTLEQDKVKPEIPVDDEAETDDVATLDIITTSSDASTLPEVQTTIGFTGTTTSPDVSEVTSKEGTTTAKLSVDDSGITTTLSTVTGTVPGVTSILESETTPSTISETREPELRTGPPVQHSDDDDDVTSVTVSSAVTTAKSDVRTTVEPETTGAEISRTTLPVQEASSTDQPADERTTAADIKDSDQVTEVSTDGTQPQSLQTLELQTVTEQTEFKEPTVPVATTSSSKKPDEIASDQLSTGSPITTVKGTDETTLGTELPTVSDIAETTTPLSQKTTESEDAAEDETEVPHGFTSFDLVTVSSEATTVAPVKATLAADSTTVAPKATSFKALPAEQPVDDETDVNDFDFVTTSSQPASETTPSSDAPTATADAASSKQQDDVTTIATSSPETISTEVTTQKVVPSEQPVDDAIDVADITATVATTTESETATEQEKELTTDAANVSLTDVPATELSTQEQTKDEVTATTMPSTDAVTQKDVPSEKPPRDATDIHDITATDATTAASDTTTGDAELATTVAADVAPTDQQPVATTSADVFSSEDKTDAIVETTTTMTADEVTQKPVASEQPADDDADVEDFTVAEDTTSASEEATKPEELQTTEAAKSTDLPPEATTATALPSKEASSTIPSTDAPTNDPASSKEPFDDETDTEQATVTDATSTQPGATSKVEEISTTVAAEVPSTNVPEEITVRPDEAQTTSGILATVTEKAATGVTTLAETTEPSSTASSEDLELHLQPKSTQKTEKPASSTPPSKTTSVLPETTTIRTSEEADSAEMTEGSFKEQSSTLQSLDLREDLHFDEPDDQDAPENLFVTDGIILEEPAKTTQKPLEEIKSSSTVTTTVKSNITQSTEPPRATEEATEEQTTRSIYTTIAEAITTFFTETTTTSPKFNLTTTQAKTEPVTELETETDTEETPQPLPPFPEDGVGPFDPIEQQPTGFGEDQPYVPMMNYGPPPVHHAQQPLDFIHDINPNICLYKGKVYMSAEQIPRPDPCDFCFCFRGDVICLQQSCPPPVPGCREDAIPGFCCPRYKCPAMKMNVTMEAPTTTTTTTVATTLKTFEGCNINGELYRVGDTVGPASSPCMHCTCGRAGTMNCIPRPCQPATMIRKMVSGPGTKFFSKR